MNSTCRSCCQKHKQNHFTSSPKLPLTCKATYPRFKHAGLGHCTGGCPIIRDWVQFYRLVKANSISVGKIHTTVRVTMMMCSAAYICANKRWWLRLWLMTQLNLGLLFGDFDLDYLFYISPKLRDHSSVNSNSKRTHVVKLSQLGQKAGAAEPPATPINTPSNGENSLC